MPPNWHAKFSRSTEQPWMIGVRYIRWAPIEIITIFLFFPYIIIHIRICLVELMKRKTESNAWMGASRYEIEKDKSPYVLVHTLLLREEDYLSCVNSGLNRKRRQVHASRIPLRSCNSIPGNTRQVAIEIITVYLFCRYIVMSVHKTWAAPTFLYRRRNIVMGCLHYNGSLDISTQVELQLQEAS